MKVNIYTLQDPINKHIRYVGATTYELSKRFKGHTTTGNLEKIKLYNYPKYIWTKSLLERGLKPIIEILDEVELDEIQFWESHYIFLYKSFGFDLFNKSLKGGEGISDLLERREKNKNIIKKEIIKKDILDKKDYFDDIFDDILKPPTNLF